MTFVSFFILGLIFGSFLNVVVSRLKTGETLLGRSYCHECGHQIRWYDNIPLLSFVWLGGKCRDCQVRLSWEYPLFEGITGLLFVLAGWLFFDMSDRATWFYTGWALGIIALFVAIAGYDLIHMEIPIVLLGVAAIWMLFFLMLNYQSGEVAFWSRPEVLSLSGALVVGAFFFALVFVSNETWMGWGDVWLGALSGMIVGLPLTLFMLTLSFGSGALIGILLMVLGKRGMKSQIPFAPFLVFGTLLTLFLSHMFPMTLGGFIL